jgi:hypothetical protein
MPQRTWRSLPLFHLAALAAALGIVACAEGVPVDDLFPSDAGRSHGSTIGSAGINMSSVTAGGSSTGIDPSASGSGGSDMGGSGGSDSSAGGDANANGGSAPQAGGSAGAGGSDSAAGAGGSGEGSSSCTAPMWDAMTVYCGQGMMGTAVSLNGKQYTCHYWTQAQNPEEHNSADNAEPWSTPTNCP